MIYVPWVAMLCCIIILAIFLIIKHAKYADLLIKTEQVNKRVNSLYEKIQYLSEERNKYYQRVIDLEDMKGDAFQVKLRNEITEVKVDFTKLEIVMIYSGIKILLERTKDPDDAKIYIRLIEKINSFIEDMKEGEDSLGS